MSEPTLQQKLELIEKWPRHCFGMRPHWVKDALFLLYDIAKGRVVSEQELREACAIIYVDHLRVEHGMYYALKREEDKEKNFRRRVKIKPPRPLPPPRKYGHAPLEKLGGVQ